MERDFNTKLWWDYTDEISAPQLHQLVIKKPPVGGFFIVLT